MKIDSETIKDIVCDIRKEYFDENGYSDGVDYIANEICDAIDNMVYRLGC